MPSVAQGQGQQAGLGILFDVGGDDTYAGNGTGNAPANITYHPMPDCGGNFGFAVNYAGNDTYNGHPNDNVYLERGSSNGFLIDRPDVPAVDVLTDIEAGGGPESPAR